MKAAAFELRAKNLVRPDYVQGGGQPFAKMLGAQALLGDGAERKGQANKNEWEQPHAARLAER